MSFFQLSRDGFVGVDRKDLRGGARSAPLGREETHERGNTAGNTISFSNVGSPKSSRASTAVGGTRPVSSARSSACDGSYSPSLSVTVESQRLGKTVKDKSLRRFDDALDHEHETVQHKLEMKRALWQAKQDTYKVHAYGSPQQRQQYKYARVHVFVFVCECECVCVCACVRESVRVSVRVSVHVSVVVCECACECSCVCVCV